MFQAFRARLIHKASLKNLHLAFHPTNVRHQPCCTYKPAILYAYNLYTYTWFVFLLCKGVTITPQSVQGAIVWINTENRCTNHRIIIMPYWFLVPVTHPHPLQATHPYSAATCTNPQITPIPAHAGSIFTRVLLWDLYIMTSFLH